MANSSPLDTLAETKDELLALGTLVQEVLTESIGALHHPGVVPYRRLVARHQDIERKRAEIEATCLLRVAGRQITPAETRCLAASLEIAAELERIAYLVRDLTRAPLTGIPEFPARASNLVPMIEDLLGFLDQALLALALGERTMARQGPQPADRINQVYTYLYRQFAQTEDPATVLKPAQLRLLLRMVQDHRQIADRIDSVYAWVLFAMAEPGPEIIKEGYA
jgi:phosphate uptake regulator